MVSTWPLAQPAYADSQTGIYYLMFTTFPGKPLNILPSVLWLMLSSDLFTGIYHFSIGISGLAYIGLGLGFVSATVVGASVADSIYQKVRILEALGFFD